MADEIDRASEREQIDRDLAIAAAAKSTPPLPAIGECYNCTASLPHGMRWCDADCRSDWDHRQSASSRLR